jgi:hypothetical protein
MHTNNTQLELQKRGEKSFALPFTASEMRSCQTILDMPEQSDEKDDEWEVEKAVMMAIPIT